MPQSKLAKSIALAGAVIAAATPVLAQSAAAQGYEYAPPPSAESQPAPAPDGYGGYAAPQGQSPQAPAPQNYAPPPEPAAPQGYNSSVTPPPPPGYNGAPYPAAQNPADQQFAYNAQAWAAQNCVKQHSNAGAGALIGGILGVIIGSGFGGRHGGGSAGGALIGGALGAGTGAVVGSAADEGSNSPGCPPGYVVRQGAYAYNYAPTGYYYAAPGWYAPWVFVGGAWVYRPYPYHDYYWHAYRGPYGHYGNGWHGGWHGRR